MLNKAQQLKFLRFLFIFLVVLALSLIIVVVQQQHVANSLRPTDGYGIYDDCAPGDPSCLSHLKTFAQGGFKLVLNYASLAGNAAAVTAYADQARAAGLKVIWGLHHPLLYNGGNPAKYYPAFAASCGCSDGPTFVTYLVNLVKNHPATWGYYVGDELGAPAYPKWKLFTDLVHQIDPTHPRLIIESTASKRYPNSAHPNLSIFGKDVEVLGDDYYPIGYSALRPYTQADKIAQDVQTVATNYGKDSAFVLQAFNMQEVFKQPRCSPWPPCATFPSKDQMTLMLNLILQNAHPRLILWYSYFDILKSDSPMQHWHDLVAAINTPVYPTPVITPS